MKMKDRYIDNYEIFPDQPEEDYFGGIAPPPYYEELDFNKDPETIYLPEEDLELEDEEQY